MLVKSEIARWTPILQAANVKVEQAGRYREGILILRFATPAAECPVRIKTGPEIVSVVSKIYAYPYKEFKAELSKESQESLEHDYKSASILGSMIVFVRDNVERK